MLARVGTEPGPDEAAGAANVAAAVVWLLEAASVTGQNLFVDAGQRFLKREGDVMFEGREGAPGHG